MESTASARDGLTSGHPEKEPAMVSGSCLCGGVRFQVKGALGPIQLCHCSHCRKAQGSAFAANIPVSTAAFALLSGDHLLAEFESSPGKTRVFCRCCGSPIFSKKVCLDGVLRIRAGLINEPLTTRPGANCFVASKADWWEIGDDLPRFEGFYRAEV